MGIEKKFENYIDRRKIAQQIIGARKSESSNSLNNPDKYTFHRTGAECLYRAGGLKYYFGYLKGLKSKKILDVGAGTGNASRVISKMPIAEGFDFEVTALRNDPELSKNFPRNKVHITEVEELRGVEKESLAGILGVNSIAYSTSPRLAVKKIDEALIPGGAVKATFCAVGRSVSFGGLDFKGPEEFIKRFKDLGYDVSLIENNKFFETGQKTKSRINSIVLAIKPGNPGAPPSIQLINLDFKEMQEDAKDYINGLPVFDIND